MFFKLMLFMLLNIILKVYEIVYLHLCYIVIYESFINILFKIKNSSMMDENTENTTLFKTINPSRF